MHTGALRNVITIEERTEASRDRLNAPVYSWSTWREPYAEVVARRGSELYDPDTKQRYSQTFVRFRCRFDDVDGLDTAMRIVFDGQTYDIRNILPDHQRRVDCIIEATVQDAAA